MGWGLFGVRTSATITGWCVHVWSVPSDVTTGPSHCRQPGGCDPGPCLNIKTIFPRYGDSHVEDKTALWPSYLQHGNPHTWERWSLYWDMGIPILLKLHLYIETGSWSPSSISAGAGPELGWWCIQFWHVNLLWPSEAMWLWGCGSSLFQVMAGC